MLLRRADAEDGTQEVLIKPSKKALPTFPRRLQVSHVLYRIAVNHILNVRRLPRRFAPFDDARAAGAGAGLGSPDPRTVPVPVRFSSRRQDRLHHGNPALPRRAAAAGFLLGNFSASATRSRGNCRGHARGTFRQILSRARRDLYEYLRGQLQPGEPRRSLPCVKKTRPYQGVSSTRWKLQIHVGLPAQVRDVADRQAGSAGTRT